MGCRLVLLCVALWEFKPAEGAQDTIFVHVQGVDAVALSTVSKVTGFRSSVRTRCLVLSRCHISDFVFLKSQLKVWVGILITLHCLKVFKSWGPEGGEGRWEQACWLYVTFHSLQLALQSFDTVQKLLKVRWAVSSVLSLCSLTFWEKRSRPVLSLFSKSKELFQFFQVPWLSLFCPGKICKILLIYTLLTANF